MDKLDVVLLMSVNPGFGGQKFIPETLNKLREARAKIDAYTAATGKTILLEVDGGVKVDNIKKLLPPAQMYAWLAVLYLAHPMQTVAIPRL